MLCEITLLRKSGLRLARSQWPEPVRGRLEISDWSGSDNNFKRHVRQAQLWDIHPTIKRPLVSPLFDPSILCTAEGGMLLSGIELQALEGGVAEHVQLWLCRPLPG